ncbi:hypothetical protein ACLBW0_13250 [Enterobacteriaceae bacterium C34A]
MDPQQLYECCIAKENIEVPETWRTGTLQCVIELRLAVELISSCRFDQTEPAHGFFPEDIVVHYEVTRE